ncbi:hypothetical protein QBC36DRAFT_82575 [Triangularia setosa]|uniref:Uncharacterized protein n=1 Tax=Triangularia setosa TaxID=2587417 RepID=A0AAN7A3M3_9PEZI|nr:hypothetical protein QBC36DRAFT_82575 [Podospora setosa]
MGISRHSPPVFLVEVFSLVQYNTAAAHTFFSRALYYLQQPACLSIIFLFHSIILLLSRYILHSRPNSPKMKFSPAATLLLLSATSSPLALAIASPQDNPDVVPAPSGSGTPLLRRQTPSNGSNTDNTVVNSRQRRALLRMRREEAPTETAITVAESAPAAAATDIPDDVDIPNDNPIIGEEGAGEVEVPDIANGTLPVNGTEGGNGTANGTLSEEEQKLRRMVKIRLPDYRRDEGVEERDVEAELGLTASIAKLLRW